MKSLYCVLYLCSVLIFSADAQRPVRGGVQRVVGVNVLYQSSFNGKPTGATFDLTAGPNRSWVKVGDEQIFVDYSCRRFLNMTVLPVGDTITMMRDFPSASALEVVGSEKILGWNCTVYRTSIRSNTIEIWATTDLGFSGTFQPESGVVDGLVLKVSRNGNTVTEAVELNQLTSCQDAFPRSWGKMTDAAGYRHAINNRDVIEIPVFDNVSIGFTGARGPISFGNASLDTVFTVAGGTVVMRKVRLPHDVGSRTVFAQVTQWAEKDAYDRTGSVFLIPATEGRSFLDALKEGGSVNSLPAFVAEADGEQYPGLISTPSYSVPLELMRFFTPFGVRGFNNVQVKGQKWADSVIYKQEITHYLPALSGEVWIGAYIGNWVDKGHRLSLKLSYHPSSAMGVNRVIPLFNTVNLLEQAGQRYPVFFDKSPLSVTFTLDTAMRSTMLVYTSTGHGGWGGGDEFNRKTNTMHLDGNQVYNYIPWRDDCATYRSLNPASGNFSNGLSSSDLSRSAWCPGTVTNPVYIPLGDLAAGRHTISVSIPLGQAQGTSFSYWLISGSIIGTISGK